MLSHHHGRHHTQDSGGPEPKAGRGSTTDDLIQTHERQEQARTPGGGSLTGGQAWTNDAPAINTKCSSCWQLEHWLASAKTRAEAELDYEDDGLTRPELLEQNFELQQELETVKNTLRVIQRAQSLTETSCKKYEQTISAIRMEQKGEAALVASDDRLVQESDEAHIETFDDAAGLAAHERHKAKKLKEVASAEAAFNLEAARKAHKEAVDHLKHVNQIMLRKQEDGTTLNDTIHAEDMNTTELENLRGKITVLESQLTVKNLVMKKLRWQKNATRAKLERVSGELASVYAKTDDRKTVLASMRESIEARIQADDAVNKAKLAEIELVRLKENCALARDMEAKGLLSSEDTQRRNQRRVRDAEQAIVDQTEKLESLRVGVAVTAEVLAEISQATQCKDQQQAYMQERFARYDLDRDGILSVAELEAMMETMLQIDLDREYFDRVLTTLDANKSGGLDYGDEFVRLWAVDFEQIACRLRAVGQH